MTASHLEIWTVIVVLGLCTFLIRFSFLGLIGGRNLPEWLLRHLRYTPMAVLPGIVAPMVLAGPSGTGPDLPRLLAAAATAGVGLATRNTLAAITAGGVTLYGGMYLLG